jgi:photosystem II stability/assembly factor-like uncharacterized protein
MMPAFLLAVALARWSSLGPPATYTSAVGVAGGAMRRLFVIGTRAGTGTGLFRSDDGGTNWESVFQATFADHPITLATHPRDADRLFVGAIHAGFSAFTALLYRSVDGGTRWTVPHQFFGASSVEVAFDTIHADTVYVIYGGIATLYVSVDGGETFSGRATPFAGGLLDVTPEGALVVVANGQIHFSRDAGESWISHSPVPFECPITALEVDPVDPNRWFLGTGHGLPECDAILRTEDSGATWTRAAGVGGPVADLTADPVRAGVLFAATFPEGASEGLGRVLATADGGETWRDLELPITTGAQSIALSDDGGHLYAATPSELYRKDLRRPRRSPPPR